MGRVLTEEAELAAGRIMYALAEYRRQESRLVDRLARAPRFGRFIRTAAPSFRESLLLPHIVAIVEEYSRARSIALANTTASSGPEMLQDLWMSSLDAIEGSWQKQIRAWKAWHQIDFHQQAPKYRSFEGFGEARHAIMHGVGSLTDKQMRKKAGVPVKDAMGQANISTSGRRIILPEDVIDRCASVSRALVVWLDRTAPLP